VLYDGSLPMLLVIALQRNREPACQVLHNKVSSSDFACDVARCLWAFHGLYTSFTCLSRPLPACLQPLGPALSRARLLEAQGYKPVLVPFTEFAAAKVRREGW
jgi:hypothetical protein